MSKREKYFSKLWRFVSLGTGSSTVRKNISSAGCGQENKILLDSRQKTV